MSDTLDVMLKQRFDAVFDSSEGADWSDVERRARALRRTPLPKQRRLVLAAAAAVAVVVIGGGVALAVGEGFFDLFSGEPAPRPVEDVVAQVDQGAPPALAPGVQAGETTELLRVQTSAGVVTLWIAPTRTGGHCLYVQRGADPRPGAGCFESTPSPSNPIVWSLQGPSENEAPMVLLFGEVAPDVAALAIEFADGSTASIPLEKGFYLIEVPSTHYAPQSRPERLVARGSDGKVIASVAIQSGYGIYPEGAG